MAEMSQEFYQLVEYGVSNPKQLPAITERLVQVLNILGSSSELVNFTLEFYKNERPVRLKALLSCLIAKGSLKDEFVLPQSCFGPFMSQLLFQTVTESAVECTKYCTDNWIDRFTNEKHATKKTPNPLQYLNTKRPTHPSTMTYPTLLQFKVLDDKERKLIILDFRKIANIIPAKFYPRLAVAFFVFMEFYKSENQGVPMEQEVCLWTETWYNMVATSLADCVAGDGHITKMTQPLHHVLCALMVSTNTVEFIASNPNVLANILNSLEMLRENSSGLTEKWMSILLSELQCKSVLYNK